jgi:hypothetical protein
MGSVFSRQTCCKIWHFSDLKRNRAAQSNLAAFGVEAHRCGPPVHLVTGSSVLVGDPGQRVFLPQRPQKCAMCIIFKTTSATPAVLTTPTLTTGSSRRQKSAAMNLTVGNLIVALRAATTTGGDDDVRVLHAGELQFVSAVTEIWDSLFLLALFHFFSLEVSKSFDFSRKGSAEEHSSHQVMVPLLWRIPLLHFADFVADFRVSSVVFFFLRSVAFC